MEQRERNLTRRDFLGAAAGSVITVGLKSCAIDGGDGEERGPVPFGVVADAQYCDRDPAGSRFYRESREKLAECVEELNRRELAFVIHLGDFIDDDFASFDTLLPIYDELTMPHYHALGNHDFAVAEERLGDVPAKLGLTERYYDFGFGGRRFVVLDGNDVSLYARPEGSEEYERAGVLLEEMKEQKRPNAQPWNGAVGAEQLAWLEATLRGARDADEETIVFCHFPVYPENVHNLWNDSEVVEVIEASGQVVAYINGHNHHGGQAVRNGIHYLTVKGMVETADSSAYAVMIGEEGRLTIDGFGRETDQVLVYGAADSV